MVICRLDHCETLSIHYKSVSVELLQQCWLQNQKAKHRTQTNSARSGGVHFIGLPYLVGIYYKLSMHTATVRFMVRSASLVSPPVFFGLCSQ